MEINYKLIEHGVDDAAPFVGAAIIGVANDKSCIKYPAINKELKKLPIITTTSQALIEQVKMYPENEGIILTGLEWSKQPLQLLDLVHEASKSDLKVMICTGCKLEQFHARIGIACAKHVGQFKEIEKLDMPRCDKDMQYISTGSQMLDYYIKHTYFINTGAYDESQKVEDYSQFGVLVESSNQKIYMIKEC